MDYFLNAGKGLDDAAGSSSGLAVSKNHIPADPAAFDNGVYHRTFAIQGDSTLGLIRNQLDFFVQDNIRVTPNLRATIGLRFALNQLPSSTDGRFEEDYSAVAQQLASENANIRCEEDRSPSFCKQVVFWSGVPS